MPSSVTAATAAAGTARDGVDDDSVDASARAAAPTANGANTAVVFESTGGSNDDDDDGDGDDVLVGVAAPAVEAALFVDSPT